MTDAQQATPTSPWDTYELTDEEERLLGFVHSYRETHDHGPTFAQVAEAMGWGWTSKAPAETWSEYRKRAQAPGAATIHLLARGRFLAGIGKTRGLRLGRRGRRFVIGTEA